MVFGFTRRRRARARARPVPREWERLLARRMPLFARLPDEDRRALLGHVHVFLDEKSFEGCGGLLVTDEMRLTIAAHACLLLLHRDPDYYPGLHAILVYPTEYVAPVAEAEGGITVEGEEGRLGEAWSRGVIVLSWADIVADLEEGRGTNLILHEFAHWLDEEGQLAAELPLLERTARYERWRQVLGAEFERLRADDAEGRATVLDRYGASEPAEFFAVATEAFFELPAALHAGHPELYAELADYYRQDPAGLARSTGPGPAERP